MSSYRNIGSHKTVGCFQLFIYGFRCFEINCFFKKCDRIFQIKCFLFFFVQLLPSLIMDWSHIFLWSSGYFVLFQFHLTLFCLCYQFFLNWHNFSDVINVCYCCYWFCCSSWLAFLIMADLINLIWHFLLHWSVCFGGDLFVHTPIFLKKTLSFGVLCLFLIC